MSSRNFPVRESNMAPTAVAAVDPPLLLEYSADRLCVVLSDSHWGWCIHRKENAVQRSHGVKGDIFSRMQRLFQRLHVLRDASQDFVKVSSQVIEDHKSLLWLVGTGSSALAGWCVYVLRRVHYERIEGAMSEISLKMKDMEKRADNEKSDVRSISKIEMVTIIAPAVVSAFSFGYLAGRAVSSYQWHKQLRLQTGLTQNKVYVAVIPAPQFEAKTLARELERAIGQNTEALETRSPWFWRRSNGETESEKITFHKSCSPPTFGFFFVALEREGRSLPTAGAGHHVMQFRLAFVDMDPAIPCGSKICTKRIKAREQQMHRERIRNMKSTVDTGMPSVATLEHVKVNLKKEQMMEDRYTEIDRDNRILLKKMTEIMKQQTTFPPAERKSGPTSLNRDARKKDGCDAFQKELQRQGLDLRAVRLVFNLFPSLLSGTLLRAMEVCFLASGQTLAVLGPDEFQGQTAKAVKQALVSKVGVTRFRQRLFWDGSREISDDEVFVSPVKIQMVKLEFWPADAEEDSQMMSACRNNDSVALEKLLQRPRCPHVKDESEQTLLYHAAMEGHLEPMKLLLEATAEIDTRRTGGATAGARPLHAAAGRGQLDAVRLLIEHGADKDGM
eukprot:s216_g38.t3